MVSPSSPSAPATPADTGARSAPGESDRQRCALLISQTFPPDPIAVGQYMGDAAEVLAERGWDVRVLTADRAYENPSERFPGREEKNGVRIRRLPFSSLGKKTIAHRLVGQLSFCVQSFLRGLFGPRPDIVLVTTSPPMGGAIGWAISICRGVPMAYWVMDINPDQAVALGKAKPGSPLVRLFDFANRLVLGRAAVVVALDRFMAATVKAKRPQMVEPEVIPPWPLEGHLERVEHADNPFRQAQGWGTDKIVFMYSGNHSLAHPLETLLDAARELRDEPRIHFAFIGGGLAKQGVDAEIAGGAPNLSSLPYQPIERLRESLSAADVHLVSMGAEMVGMVHPCKIYGAMSIGRPILLLGPAHSHAGEIVQSTECGVQVEHGDVEGCLAAIRALADEGPGARAERGERGREAIDRSLGRSVLAARFCALLEAATAEPSGAGSLA
ncbi:MAG: glycosyltransferase family 4 protein [Opitutales bacterium]